MHLFLPVRWRNFGRISVLSIKGADTREIRNLWSSPVVLRRRDTPTAVVYRLPCPPSLAFARRSRKRDLRGSASTFQVRPPQASVTTVCLFGIARERGGGTNYKAYCGTITCRVDSFWLQFYTGDAPFVNLSFLRGARIFSQHPTIASCWTSALSPPTGTSLNQCKPTSPPLLSLAREINEDKRRERQETTRRAGGAQMKRRR